MNDYYLKFYKMLARVAPSRMVSSLDTKSWSSFCFRKESHITRRGTSTSNSLVKMRIASKLKETKYNYFINELIPVK